MSKDTTVSADSTKISPDDIKAKLVDIQAEATSTVESARNQIVAAGIGVGLALLIIAFLLGRRGGMAKSTIIEVRRA